MAVGQTLKLRLFMEGIEVPIVSASMSIQPDSPAQCQIQIPATDKALEFLPRTLVHVFFYDFYGGPGDTIRAVADDPRRVTTADEAVRSEEEDEAAGQTEEGTTSTDPTTTGSVASRSTTTDVTPTTEAPSTPSGELPSDGHPAPAGPTTTGQQRGEGEEEDIEAEEPAIADLKWKLFFCGEVIGFQFTKSTSGRSVILQCLDLSVYWDTCYQYKVNVANLTGNGLAHFVGAGTTLWDTFFQSSTSTIVDVINRRSYSQPDLTGLLSGVVHLLERVGGVYTRGNRSFRGVNDFFTIAELRLHLVDMITASEHDNSSQRLFPRRAFNRWTRREGGRLGKIASFREILNLLNKFIFHNTIPCPIAKFDGPATRQRQRTTRYNISSTAAGRAVIAELNRAEITAARLQNLWTTYRDRRSAYQYTTEATDGPEVTPIVALPPEPELPPTHDFTPAHMVSSYRHLNRRLTGIGESLRSLNATDAAAEVRTAYNASQGLQTAFGNGSWSSNTSQVSSSVDLVRDAIASAILSVGGVTRSRTRSEEYTVGSRLNSQIIRPDIFMVSPPRCNVLFPELYSQVSFNRQYLRETTRMRLTVSDEIFGPDSLLDNWYYAPDVEVLGERARQGRGGNLEGATLQRSAYTRRLMNHELFTGVVPVFERMNEVNIAAGRSNHVIYRGARVPFAARAANFQFFKHRFGPRSMSVSGKFNPWAVPGFPSLVIDRYMTESQIEISNLRGLDLLDTSLARGWARVAEDRENQPYLEVSDSFAPIDVWLALRETVPTQFLGLIMQMQHNVTQQAAGTSYAMSTGRTHREKEELLGANELQVSQRHAGQATRVTTVAAMETDPPRPGQMGPYYGLITTVNRLNRSGRYHLFGTFGADRVHRQRTKVPVNVTQQARAYGPEVITLVNDPSAMVTFRAYEITEEVDRWRGQRVEVPMEDFLRPPWMSDVWASDRIGAVYQQFFGTGSITDPMTIDTGYTRGFESRDSEHQDVETEARRYRVQDPIQANGRTVQEAEGAFNVERAVDLLVRAYSGIRHVEGADAHEFIRAYTWRPVATMIDMLGSRDLEIDPRSGRRTRGTEGMHSRAFGSGQMGQNLRNLVPEAPGEDHPPARLLGIATGEGRDRRNLLTRLDKRSEKSDKVREYVDELWASRGQLG